MSEEKGNKEQKAVVAQKEIPEDLTKEQIRVLVSNVYDLQKLRIAVGNRIVQSFYISLGINTKKKLSDSENKAKEELKGVQLFSKEFKRITDYAAFKNISVNGAIKELSGFKEGESPENAMPKKTSRSKKPKGEQPVKPLEFIRSGNDYRLVGSYMHLLSSEGEAVKVLDKYVVQHPMWEEFFKDIRGCGTLMAAICIAYLDPYKARHVSSFYKYCGIDTVKDMDEYGNVLYWDKDRTGKLREKYQFVSEFGDVYDISGVKSLGEFSSDGNEIFESSDGTLCTKEQVVTWVNGEEVQVFEYIESGKEYTGEVTVSEHGRRKGDTEMYEYTAKDGSTKLKRGITYNPVLKSKLLGVLSGCLLKAKDPVYSKIFYDYRERLDKSEHHKNKTGIHKLRMAERYVIKQFLRNLWTTWRKYEGLQVDLPYEVEKLGHAPHAYNQYQCNVAKRSLGQYAGE